MLEQVWLGSNNRPVEGRNRKSLTSSDREGEEITNDVGRKREGKRTTRGAYIW